VFVDWSQNDQHKTTISVYSLRAREHPTVSTPISWEEVENALRKKDAERLVFEAKDVLARVEKMGDLFAPVLTLKQKLPELAGVVEAADKDEKEGLSIAAQSESKAATRPRGKETKTKETKTKVARAKSKAPAGKRRKL
jgi:bifunctional non-homologous end joining protein LigD